MEITFNDKMAAVEKTREEKWKTVHETNVRESLIEQYEKEHGKMTQDQLEKIRKMYDVYVKEGKEFKIEYIGIILNYYKTIDYRKDNCKHEDIYCGVEKRGCKGCYYEKEEER